MSDGKNKKPEGDKLTKPESPKAISEQTPVGPQAQEREVRKTREQAEEALRAEKQNKAHALKSHVMGLGMLRQWHNEKGEVVGMVDANGRSLKAYIENSILRTGALIQAEDPEDLPPVIQQKLEEAAALMDPEMAEATKAVLDPVEERIAEIKEKIANLEENPNYLLDFKIGGSLRDEIAEVLQLMEPGRPVWEQLHNHEWVQENNARAHFLGSMTKRMTDAMDKPEAEIYSTQLIARFEFHEELRAEILELAAKGGEVLEIAKRMPALMADELNLLFNSIAGQIGAIYGMKDFELGETDAESMAVAVKTLNQCLAAMIDIGRTKKLIPTLS